MKRSSFFLYILFLVIQVQAFASEITVIGAGLAGLTAAYRIEQLTGHPVAVYEARSRPGGRVYTVYLGSSYEELGGKFLNDGGEAVHIKYLMKELGLETVFFDSGLSQRKYAYRNKVYPYFDLYEKALPANEETFALFLKWSKEVSTLAEVLDKVCEGKDIIRHLTEIRMRNYEGNDTKDLSSTYVHSFWISYSRNYLACKTGQPNYQFEVIQGGSSKLAEKLANSLSTSIHYNSPLRKISRTADGKFLLNFEGNQEKITDYVILALPCTTLRDISIEEGILPADQKTAIETLQYGSNARILMPFTGSVEPGYDFSVTEDAITWFNNDYSIMSLHFGGKTGLFNSLSQEELLQKILSELPDLKLLYPSLTFPNGVQLEPLKDQMFSHYTQPVGISWIHEKFSKGSYSSWGVGQFLLFDEKEPHLGELTRKVFRPIENRIFFAGEHTALDYPATMEGAVESGERTARMIFRIL